MKLFTIIKKFYQNFKDLSELIDDEIFKINIRLREIF